MTLELCSNVEWLRENTGLDLSVIEESQHNEAAEELRGEIHAALVRHGFDVESARGQRRLYHGWNGANLFRHKIGPIGTFDVLTVDQIEIIERVIDECVKSIEHRYAGALA